MGILAKKIIIYCYYRQWRHVNLNPSETKQIKDKQQLNYFENITQTIYKNRKLRDEIIVIGDLNFDAKFLTGKKTVTSHEVKTSKFAEITD